MTLDVMKKLKIGDKIVHVRKSFQNYDHSKIPCEPKVFTISWIGGGEKSFEELVKTPWFHDEDKIIYISAGGIGNRQICDNFVTYNDYISGNYNSGIIVDNSRWPGGLEELLEFKRTKDHKESKERARLTRLELELKHKVK